MRNRIFAGIVGAALALSLTFGSSVALAQSYDPDQDLPRPTLLEKRVNKLGRGLGNLLFGWTEIPVTWNNKMQEGKPLQYLLSTAPLIGVVKAFMRTGIGVFEIVTFPNSKPEVNYEPLIEPEYLF